MKTQTQKSNKKVLLLSVLAIMLVVCVAFGTMAWLTAEDSVTNTFTVGDFTKPETTNPETPEPDPGAGNPEKPNIGLGGYIIEPSWDTSDNAEHKLVPGGSLYKDPYVGIGKGSEAAVIYVYIDNPFKNNSVYFTLNEGWEAVSEYSQAGTEPDTYVGGLFKYTDVLTASDSADSWTAKPVFTKINVSEDATNEDFDVEEKSIEVSCFIHQAYDGEGSPIDAATIENAAVAALAQP